VVITWSLRNFYFELCFRDRLSVFAQDINHITIGGVSQIAIIEFIGTLKGIDQNLTCDFQVNIFFIGVLEFPSKYEIQLNGLRRDHVLNHQIILSA
jgi:hypothetical protein